jgi:hypothetical protein
MGNLSERQQHLAEGSVLLAEQVTTSKVLLLLWSMSGSSGAIHSTSK